jgi:hypothetical protein
MSSVGHALTKHFVPLAILYQTMCLVYAMIYQTIGLK